MSEVHNSDQLNGVFVVLRRVKEILIPSDGITEYGISHDTKMDVIGIIHGTMMCLNINSSEYAELAEYQEFLYSM